MRAPFFTSDTHFGHANIMKFCPATRPYSTVAEMDEAMIEAWNHVVSPNDEVYHLGDFTFYSKPEQVRQIVRRLNGRKHLILGNHDTVFFDAIRRNDRSLLDLFASIDSYREIRFNGQKIVMCHFAFRVWNQSHRGAWNLYGHSHGSLPGVGKQMDVGWDSSERITSVPGPISYTEVEQIMATRVTVPVDHHQERA